MFGILDQPPFWYAVSKLYDQDKLQGAYETLQKLGSGVVGTGMSLLRLVEAEYDVRRRGVQKELDENLTLEYIPEEQIEHIDPLCALTVQSIAAEKKEFGWNRDEKVLITLLAVSEDAPWMTSRFGYCAQKADYYKICIPFHATVESSRYQRVLTHEFAHVMSMSQTGRRINQWVGEGFSVYASSDCSERARQVFKANPDQWLNEKALEIQFGPGLDLGSSQKWLAYQQAGWIMTYLSKLGGNQKIMSFLGEYANESILRNLKLLALSESHTHDALHAAYGLTTGQLFADALRFL